MKRKRPSNSQKTDLCGSFLVNVLDLSKILNGKNKSRTVHKLTCLKELLDLSTVSGSSSESTEENNTIVISDSESETHEIEETVTVEDTNHVTETKIKKETLFEHKKMSRLKRRVSSSCSDNSDDENDISKIKNYVKESLLKGLAFDSHNNSCDKISENIKEEPVESEGKEVEDKSCLESKEITNANARRKRIRLTRRRHSSYQGKRLLRYYRNLKRRPKLERFLSRPQITTVTDHNEESSKEEAASEVTPSVEQETKETAVQVEETPIPEVLSEEALPSSTTNDQDILTLSRLEELKVQITEDETTVYITILDGTITIPDVLEVLRCTTPGEVEVLETQACESSEVERVTPVTEEVRPFVSQIQYNSVYTTASSGTGTNGK